MSKQSIKAKIRPRDSPGSEVMEFATGYYTENGTIKNPDISNRRRIYLDTILIYIHPAARRVLKMVFIALILAIIFGSIGQSIRA